MFVCEFILSDICGIEVVGIDSMSGSVSVIKAGNSLSSKSKCSATTTTCRGLH